MKKYIEFIKENSDIIEFPLKKFISIINDNFDIHKNKNYFDFSKEITLPISFNIIINYDNIGDFYCYAFINEQQIKHNNYLNFDITLNIKGKNINKEQILSVLTHELKHVYDLYYDINKDSIDTVTYYLLFKKKYSNNKYILHFLELSNLALQHEIDARERMLYGKLRWLKTYDDILLKKEFEDTYIYKSLNMLKNFNKNSLINNIDLHTLLDFTNEFINKWIKKNYKVYDKIDLIKFYTEQEIIFNKISDKTLKTCHDIIDELIKDKRPYMENNLFIIEDYFCSLDEQTTNKEKYIKEIINNLYI